GADAIVATEDIKTLEDLNGKKIALTRDDVGETFLSGVFVKKGLPLKDLILVPSDPDNVAKTFVNGEADACVTWEPQVTQALQRPGAHLLATSKEYPGIILDTLNVRKDLLEKDPESVKKVMRAWFMALKYYREHTGEAIAIMAKYYNITPEEYQKQISGLKWNDYEDQKSLSEKQEWIDGFKTIAQNKLLNKRISKAPEAEQFINHALLENLYETRL
ncbi:MAG: ABC transporter substrate-binding protein, partial [Candidatus Omnitrophica bacterium]|nr:ABC transporter substrate-binding protein [Candidatus Omnitrophota bacterium]